MADVKVVIGANFGDEGKGLMTDYLCHQSTSQNKKCVVILSNGGAQRGHTVTTPDGKSHVFKHFGSGTFAGADTYFPEEFVLNPMTFNAEMVALVEMGYTPNVYMSFGCRWTTPWDMMVNQIVEESRGDKRHGSCGMGIWETVERWKATGQGILITTFNSLNIEDKVEYLKKVRNYCKERLEHHYGVTINDKWKEIFFSENLIGHFISDIDTMCSVVHPKYVASLYDSYDTVVYENGQGLLLSETAMRVYGNNTTPSDTGALNALKSIYNSDVNSDVELVYVTRTYMTRHGAGDFYTECDKSLLNADMCDDTNIENCFQGKLRYGELNYKGLVSRVLADSTRIALPNVSTSVAFTHTNELPLENFDFEKHGISKIYTSDNKTRNSVKI